MKLEGKKFLLVEDDMFLSDMFIRRLKVEGAETILAKNGEEGLAKLQEQKFDMVITDLMMDKVSGQELIKKAQEDEKTKDIPIVVLTNLISSISTKEELEELKKSGISGLFIKSNTALSEVVEAIVGILEKK
jgi:CheY-like chemotaxis protein